MTEKRKRDAALKQYLTDACPYTKHEIMQLVKAGVVRVVWQRGVLGFKVANEQTEYVLNHLIEKGKTPPITRAKRTDFAIRPMPHDIPHVETVAPTQLSMHRRFRPASEA